MTHPLVTYLLGIACGLLVGWLYAHQVIASECRRLGGFYVGRSTFKCTEIIPPKTHYPGAPANPHRTHAE